MYIYKIYFNIIAFIKFVFIAHITLTIFDYNRHTNFNDLFNQQKNNLPFTSLTSKANYSAYAYLLRIKFPKYVDTTPNICGYYKGYKIEFEEDFCVINQNKLINQFILIVTPEIKYKADGNNIQHLERIKNKPCSMYFINAKIDDKKNRITDWVIEKESTQNLPISLPQEALVILMNPNHIKCLKFENKHSTKIDDNIINLPNIIIKDKLSKKEINQSSIENILATLDHNFIHTPLKKNLKNEQNKIIQIKKLER